MSKQSADTSAHTATPYYLGSQNDQLYITAGEPPAQSNDHPNHDANRTLIAKVFDEKHGKFIVRACNSYDQLVAENARLLAALEPE